MRLFFLCLAIIAGLAVALPAQAQTDPYTVTGVKVDVTAANAVDARTKAFGQAQQAAFVQLAQHFLTPDQAKGFQPPAPEQITPLVNDFEVTNEQLSSVRYVGTYTFRFRPGPSRALIVARAPAASVQPDQQAAVETPTNAGPASPTARPAAASAPDDGAWQGPAAESAPGLQVRVHYAGLPDWIAAQRALRQTPGVKNLRVTSVSPVQGTVALQYQGGVDALRPALLRSGYTLSLSENGGAYDLTSSNAGSWQATSIP